MKGESLGGLSNVKIVVVVMVFSYDVIVMGVNVGNKCVLRYNSDVLNRVQHRIIVTECCFVFYCKTDLLIILSQLIENVLELWLTL